MRTVLLPLVYRVVATVRGRAALQLEIVALRHQVLVLQRSGPKRPRLTASDRALWSCLALVWPGWQQSLVLVHPETVIRWHRRGFRLFWTWKSRRRRAGRPGVPREVRDLIRQMAQANPIWGAPRIHGELLKLGIEVGQTTVAKCMPRRPKSPSQGWRTFLRNHLHETIAIDFAVVPTVAFRLLFAFVVLGLDRRRILHVNVTTNPTAEWTAQQLVEACPWETTAQYVIRDRDRIYGRAFRRRLAGLGLREVIIGWRSPWQNGYVERFIGSLRRELLDHVIALDEAHLRRLLREYVRYYDRTRTHLALVKDAPEWRRVDKTGGQVKSVPLSTVAMCVSEGCGYAASRHS